MANRARDHRKDIPGYDESRPTSDARRRQHRAVRHAAHQILRTVEDPEEFVESLPEIRRSGNGVEPHVEKTPGRRRFRVWKTKFWKRRGSYRDLKARLDAQWPVIPPNDLE